MSGHLTCKKPVTDVWVVEVSKSLLLNKEQVAKQILLNPQVPWGAKVSVVRDKQLELRDAYVQGSWLVSDAVILREFMPI